MISNHEVATLSNQTQSVENYTNTCLVMGLVNLMWIMIVLWAWKGFLAALLLGAGVHHGITLLDKRLAKTRN